MCLPRSERVLYVPVRPAKKNDAEFVAQHCRRTPIFQTAASGIQNDSRMPALISMFDLFRIFQMPKRQTSFFIPAQGVDDCPASRVQSVQLYITPNRFHMAKRTAAARTEIMELRQAEGWARVLSWAEGLPRHAADAADVADVPRVLVGQQDPPARSTKGTPD